VPKISLEQATAAKKEALRRFGQLTTLTGVGITRVKGEYAVKVNVSEPLDDDDSVPTTIDGVTVRVEVTGTIRPRGGSR
jgi:hypothetical protein